jgi:predicted MFS family arabinose efflux permease
MTGSLGAARLACRLQFFVNGLLFASWGVNVPVFKLQHGLSEAELALAMLGAGIGALLALVQAGALIGHFGARRVCAWNGVASAAAIGALLLLPSFTAGLVCLFVFGLASSLSDVAVNAHAVELESAYARPIMSSCHGFFSLGGLAGAGLASLLTLATVEPATQLRGLAIAAAVCALAVVPDMLPDRAPQATAQEPRFLHLRGAMAILGTMAALGLLAEGAMYDWSVLYLRQSLGAPQPLAALAYGAFSFAMAGGRFAGDWARARWGAATLLCASGALAASAMLALLAIAHPLAALAGFALVGLGISNVVPVLFAAASKLRGVTPAHGIAGVAGMGYLGMLAGPPLIGLIAQFSSLPLALCLVALSAAALALLARRALAPTDVAPVGAVT